VHNYFTQISCQSGRDSWVGITTGYGLEGLRIESITVTWLKTWELVGQQRNPTYAGRIPSTTAYLRYYVLNMAYIAPPQLDQTPTHFKRNVYDSLLKMELATRTMEMRVVQKSPNTDWDRVWRNLHASCGSEVVPPAWYLVIHELIPTNERLATIHLVDSTHADSAEDQTR
jgi:hypothetical protein